MNETKTYCFILSRQEEKNEIPSYMQNARPEKMFTKMGHAFHV